MKSNFNKILMISCSMLLFLTSINPIIMHADSAQVKGCDKGPSHLPVVPMKQTTFVQFDENSLIDDYAYLASIPTAAFQQDGIMYSHPLLFYQDRYDYEYEYEKPLNARQGLDYFMEDWMSYCHGTLDEMTLINIPNEKVDHWDANVYTTLTSDDPYEIASTIALNEWSYSDSAVVAVIKEHYETPSDETMEYTLTETLPPYAIDYKTMKAQKPSIGLGATYESFDITDQNYKYILTKMSWKTKVDYDLQLFDTQLGMVQSAAKQYDSPYPYFEIAASYIHNYGEWEVSVSAIQKKGDTNDLGKMENIYMKAMGISDETSKTSLFSKESETVDIDVALFPGTMVDLKNVPFGCRDVEITLTWDSNVDLGFTLIGPKGTEIDSTISVEDLAEKSFDSQDENQGSSYGNKELTMQVNSLGECEPGENYSLCIFSLDDIHYPIDFDISYSWKQKINIDECKGLSSASNGAILASTQNIPLLYTDENNLPSCTKDALYTLGVKNILLVDLGKDLTSETEQDIRQISPVKKTFRSMDSIYHEIMDNTGQKDVIFTTIDPWSYWYINKREPEGEYAKGFHIGPAAFIAAHHGSPVIIIENHPQLSQASVWATDWWIKNAVNRFIEPSSGSMVYTSQIVYDFLESYGFGSINKDSPHSDQEVIITVAGQFDIGTPWDRCFTGAALPGRFWGHPVDSAYTISRNIFYPSLIFQNPAMQGENLYINGSSSRVERGLVKGILARLKEPKGINLVQTKPSQEEPFTYPILATFEQFVYRYNLESADHFNCLYTRADGIIPGITASTDPIDEGAVPGKSGAYYPDLSETDVIPFYAKKAGFESVFSTNFEKIIDNLNRGVLLWVLDAHGQFPDGGKISFWDPNSPYAHEENPWRSYESILAKPGHIRTIFLYWLPYLQSNQTEAYAKKIPFQLFTEVGSTENPDVALINYQLTRINTLLDNLNLHIDCWGAFGRMFYKDRIKHPIETLTENLPFVNFYEGDGKVTISPMSGHYVTSKWYTGEEFDERLENLHSCGIDASSCLPANTYIHLTWMRHGTSYQIIDPWTTTDWAATWQQLMIKYFAKGATIGEAYERGMRACAPEYSIDQWWWDIWENVELFGDPNLRIFVPSTEFSSENYWTLDETLPQLYDEKLEFNGHMPFGASDHPHEKEPLIFGEYTIPIIAIIAVVILLLFTIFIPGRKEK